MKRDIEIMKGDVVVQSRGGEYIALIVGHPQYEGRSDFSQVRAIQQLNLQLWREQFEQRQVRERAWRDLRHLLRRSLGLPTWWPRWLISRARRRQFEAVVQGAATTCDEANRMRPALGSRLGWPDVVLVAEGAGGRR